jgi:hypothetical protein
MNREAYAAQLAGFRAEALLTVALTARNDLLLTETKLESDNGLDYLVKIVEGGIPTTKLFGIQLKARIRLMGIPSIELPSEQIDLYRDLPFPLCLVLFDMQTDKGYYRWLVEPTFTKDGRPILLSIFGDGVSQSGDRKAMVRITDFSELNTESLNSLIDAINAWYAARRAPVARAS